MISRLESLALQIEQEILTAKSLTVGGRIYKGNTLARNNLYAGLCHAAAARVKELAPDLEVTLRSFIVSRKALFKSGRHTIAEVQTPEGLYHVDPTIKQYLPGGKLVYGPDEMYPLKIVPGSEYPK